MSRAFVFPGQGSQAVGMGKVVAESYAAAREVYQEVDEALAQNLSTLMFEGPEDELTLTENAQPALMAASLAVIRVLQSEAGFNIVDHVSHVAGHSLGEYSALCAVGTFSLADTARLLKTRGKAMQEAVPVGEGAMAALLGLNPADAEAVAEEAQQGEVCDFANDNATGQVVVSGAVGAIERAIEIAKAKGAKRAVLLPVSAPFHCAMMAPAADVMAAALAEVMMNDPALPVVANVVARPVTEAAEMRQLLVEQVTGRVRWRECVLAMKSVGVDSIIEIGHGKVLSGMTKRIDRDLTGSSIGTPEEIAAFLTDL